MEPILTSFFEIFKVGPGPSSSHTIGPMNAALHFKKAIEKLSKNLLSSATHIKVYLYGALSATGKGHGTDRAILAGLMGWESDNCDCDRLLSFFSKRSDSYEVDFKGKKIVIDRGSFNFAEIHHLFPYSNTMILQLLAKDRLLLEKEYYSIGGGFIECKGERRKKDVVPPHTYSNLSGLKRIMAESGISLDNLLIENEMAISGLSKSQIFEKFFHIIDVMEEAVERGIKSHDILPGPLKLMRRAPTIFKNLKTAKDIELPDRFFLLLDAYALAVAEENAAGKLVVTAPTSGACGVIPSVVYLLKNYFKMDKEIIVRGLLAAGMIGFIAKHNASISGAEVGCQGEIGVASAMAAAMLAHVHGRPISMIDNAAKIALKHFLGLTCDPIGGYVQIPCIERNAAAAVAAYNAYFLSSYGDPQKQKLLFDQVVEAMLKTGKDMCIKYKETSKGGLALSEAEC